MANRRWVPLVSLAGSVIMAIALTSFAFSFHPSLPHEEKAESWMKDVSDAKSISELSIPATHDSGALHSIADVAGKCQDAKISEQLKIGVRCLDIRLQQVDDRMAIVHGFINENYSFHSALGECVDFLKEHPSEGLLLSIKLEEKSVSSFMSFEECLLKEIGEYDASYFHYGVDIPTLGELRGKVSFLCRYPNSTIGIPAYEGWKEPSEDTNTFEMDSSVYVQDYYKFTDIEKKKAEVEKCLSFSSDALFRDGRLVMNFFSGYYKNGFPPSYAGTVAKEMNAWAKDHLQDYDMTGVCLFDFLSAETSQMIWSKNL